MHPYFFDPPARPERDRPGAERPFIRRGPAQVLEFKPAATAHQIVPEVKRHPPPGTNAKPQRRGGLIGLFKRRFTPAPAF